MVSTDLAGGIATLTLNSPATGNALSAELAAAFAEAAEATAGDDSVRLIVLRANGRAFCVGGDLSLMRRAGENVRGAVAELAGDLHRGLKALHHADALVLAVVQGVAAGAGFSIVAGADLAIASTAAAFTLAYTRAGLTPDGGASWTLPRLLGSRRALELIIGNPMLSAEQAARLGIINRVVPPERLDQEADAWADELANGPASTFGQVKRLLRDAVNRPYADQLDAEAAAIAERAASADGREGISAFLEKRAPDFNPQPHGAR
jgi:2-(1,2-epoxy-1,2-dihydrophenyl)acetyl-CoA isomerase